MKQEIGIPMGSPISPVLAILVCAYCEAKYTGSRNPVIRKIRGSRYVDDAIFCVGYSTKVDKDVEWAQSLIDDIVKNGYHKKLELEMDPNQNYINMLESVINTTQVGNITARFWHKNAEQMRDHGTQKLLKFQDYHSFAPESAKRGVLISTLIRIKKSVSHLENVSLAIPMLFKELDTLHYPKSFIKRAMAAMIIREPAEKEFWESMMI